MATEAAPLAADNGEEDSEDSTLNNAYVSPLSSEHPKAKEPKPASRKRETIHRISSQNSSDSEPIPAAPPVHQFVPHSSSIYDSDASDGR